MCGIVGFFDKTSNQGPVGSTVYRMLTALACRGPDSAGVALYGKNHNDSLVLRVKLGEHGPFEERAKEMVGLIKQWAKVRDAEAIAEYLRVEVVYGGEPRDLAQKIEAVDSFEVVSMGHALEIIKQVGSPENLNDTYNISKIRGSHGLGHTRLSTESRIDLSHSQPFWAHGVPDVAVVHNGHITNYHKLRHRYEQHGVRFYTDNDSEVIGVYLAHQMAKGMSLEEALQASIYDLDGSFSYLAATAEEMGFAKDRFALKPLLFTETDEFVTVATEEIAIQQAFPGVAGVREAQAKEVRVWRN